MKRNLFKATMLAAVLCTGLAVPAQARAVLVLYYKNAQGEFKTVTAQLQDASMTLFDCREAMGDAVPTLRRQLANAENHPDLVGWRYSTANCRTID